MYIYGKKTLKKDFFFRFINSQKIKENENSLINIYHFMYVYYAIVLFLFKIKRMKK